MTLSTPKPAAHHERLWAWTALTGIAILVVAGVLFVLGNAVYVVIGIAGLLIAVVGGWWLIASPMPRRAFGIIGLALGAGLLIFAIVEARSDAPHRLAGIILLSLLILISVTAGRAALVGAARETTEQQFCQAKRPDRPVLICNPWSGGGKVAEFHLPELASSLGIETVMLDHGLDLEQLARDAISRGCDCIGMAGGDGSQALVASIAIEQHVPFVCVSAGTRNHFALDLGLDREDPRKSVYAFRDALERRVDFATVNGRLFVNNVSLGVYATIVQDPAYRDAKLETSKSLLPELLGQTENPFDLQFTTPDGVEVDGAFLIMVSNNPYVLGPSLDLSQRRRLDTGRLGVFAVSARSGRDAADVVAHTLTGRSSKRGRAFQFSTDELEVRSKSGTAYAGVDGEALTLPTPLTFRIHPQGLRMFVPSGNDDAAIRRQSRDLHLDSLFSIARGPRTGSAV